jgi:hypothetical protein
MTSTTQDETTRDIATTVRTALNGRGQGSYYDSYAPPVVAALVERETDLSEKLIDYAVDAGADGTEVKAYLREIGMAVATDPEPETQAEESADPEDILTRIDANLRTLTATVTSLTDFARRNGYRG